MKAEKRLSLAVTIIIAIGMWMAVILVIFYNNQIDAGNFYSLKDNMTIDVFHKDGTSDHFDSAEFGRITKGEQIQVHIQLTDTFNLNASEMYFALNNAIVNAYMDGRMIYEDKYDPSDISSHYGNRIYEIPLSSEYQSKEIILDITATVRVDSSDIKKIGLIPSNNGWKQIIKGKSLIFSTSLTLMVLAMISIFYFGLRSIVMKKMQLGLPIAVFEFFINAWFFGSMGMFHLILGNREVCAKIEYYSLYIAPIPLAFFICTVLDETVIKKIVGIISKLYAVYYLVVTAIELSPMQMNYSDMLMSMHIFAAVLVVFLVIGLFFGTKSRRDRNIRILRGGVLISLFCGLMEILRFNVIKYALHLSWVSIYGTSVVAILTIAVALVVYLISFTTDEYTAKVEKKQLMLLAYRDALTEMPNRAACYRQIEEMESQGIKDYTMVFIDLNNLKLANDSYGHDMGDELLKMTADNIKAVFSENGFCSRWGGDEFVACVFGDENEAKERIQIFQNKMKEEDDSKRFPFQVSAACGDIRSSEEHYLAPVEAIRQADEIMYANKKQMKEEEIEKI